LIAAAADAFVDAALGGGGADPDTFPADVRRLYIDALRAPASAHAICEEYRAAATLDYAADRHDRAAGRQIVAPTLVLWAAAGPLDQWYEDVGGPVGIWRRWARDVAGEPVAGGHFFPEQNPGDTITALLAFLGH
jgi:haloacetate dehalogenase